MFLCIHVFLYIDLALLSKSVFNYFLWRQKELAYCPNELMLHQNNSQHIICEEKELIRIIFTIQLNFSLFVLHSSLKLLSVKVQVSLLRVLSYFAVFKV